MKYEIKGGNLPVVICTLDKGEEIICDSGAMSWMDPCMKMETSTNGGIGKAFGRMINGETIFQNKYHATDNGIIAFSSSFPGAILAFDIVPGKEIIVQKSSFLACESGVNMELFFNKKLKTGFFGGEGFVMTKLSGQGTAFVEIDGSTVEYDLAPGQQMVIDTGYLTIMDATCTLEAQTVPGIKNKFLGGEGIFNTIVTGPGRIVVQTMPTSAFVSNIIPFLPNGK